MHNNSLHHLPIAMAPAVDVPMVTTLHTPPLPMVESALALCPRPPRFVAVSEWTASAWRHAVDSDVVLNGLDTARLAGRTRRRTRPCGRAGSCRRRRPTWRSRPAAIAGVPLVLAGPVQDQAYFEREVGAAAWATTPTTPGTSRSAISSALLRQASVAVVTPMWDEPYGLVAAEAMASGTPVATFARGGLSQVVSPQGGVLAAPGDTAALAEARRGRGTARPGRRARLRGVDVQRRRDGRELPRPLRRAHPPGRRGVTRDGATGVVGYYVHHVGSGHRHRAQVLAARLRRDGVAVTGLSSLPRPDGWDGDWVRLPRDDDGDPRDVSAHGHLHWAPLLHDGTRSRAAALSAWLETARPDLLVVDVSVEVLLLARLHGIPAVGVVLPGRRDDRAHLLGSASPRRWSGSGRAAARDMTPGLPDDLRERLVPVGALSRHPVRTAPEQRPRQPAYGRPAAGLGWSRRHRRRRTRSRRQPRPTGSWHGARRRPQHLGRGPVGGARRRRRRGHPRRAERARRGGRGPPARRRRCRSADPTTSSRRPAAVLARRLAGRRRGRLARAGGVGRRARPGGRARPRRLGRVVRRPGRRPVRRRRPASPRAPRRPERPRDPRRRRHDRPRPARAPRRAAPLARPRHPPARRTTSPSRWTTPRIVEEQVDGLAREVVAVGRGPAGGLPLAAARNLGVRTALDARRRRRGAARRRLPGRARPRGGVRRRGHGRTRSASGRAR